MKKTNLISTTFACSILFSAPALHAISLTTMDFNSFAYDDIVSGPIEENGIRLSSLNGPYWISDADGDAKLDVHSTSTNPGTWTIDMVNGTSFSLFSMELIPFSVNDINLTGHFTSGGTISHTIVNPPYDGEYFLPGTFSNLSFVTLSSVDNKILFDSITVEPVPVPAAVWLFGSGLIGLLSMAKRNKK